MTEGKGSRLDTRILVIDDEPLLLRATSRLLVEAGYQVLEAAAGGEGLRLAREARPDLVLLDVMLPDMDGLEVCRRLKADAKLSNTLVVLLSGKKIDSDNQAEGLEEGADDYVVRPVSNRELLARVGAMLRIRRAEEMRRLQMHELQERVKELNCLYGISKLIEQSGLSLSEILQGVVELIPPAWQYPEVGCARILLEDQAFQTKGFRETIWKQGRDIQVHGEPAGRIEVFYLEDRPEEDEGPFLEEERRLLDAIAERLGRIVERIRAEQARSESEGRYRAVSELTSDLAYAFRVERDGSLVREWMTQALSQVTGFSSEELAARGDWASVIHPDDRPAAQRHIQKILSGQQDVHEFRIITKDGRVRWLHDSGYPVRDETQGRTVRIFGAARDITERKRVEQVLRQYETIVSTVSDPISYLDKDCVYRAVNETYARYAKRPREEIIGLSVAELLGREVFEEQVKPHLDRCLEGEEVHYQAWFPVPGEQARYMDVGYYPVRDDNGAVGGVVVASRDMTERKTVEEALQRERDLVSQVMDTSPVGIAVFDRQGRMTFANSLLQQLASLVGVTTLVGRPYDDPTWPSVTDGGEPLCDELLPFAQVMESGGPVHNIEYGIELPGGPRLHLSSNAAPLFDGAGQIDSVVVTTEDITQRKRAEAQLEEAAAAAERERLARDLHDAVTQSLFSVAAIAEALPRVWEREPEEARRSLEDLRWLTQGALAEMRAMLVELRPAALTEHTLSVLLRQLADAMMSRTRMPVTTTVVGDYPLPADVQIGLYRIAQEALNNITKHARASQAKLGLHCEPGQVRLSISDDGLGFDLESAQAHQLGLEIMRERAQAIGASLTIESQPSHGTRIEVHWHKR
ncbi:MAG: PAS domain-containing protein [Anaerolineae bacterium]|jgi:PAS domain S-box-containing protein